MTERVLAAGAVGSQAMTETVSDAKPLTVNYKYLEPNEHFIPTRWPHAEQIRESVRRSVQHHMMESRRIVCDDDVTALRDRVLSIYSHVHPHGKEAHKSKLDTSVCEVLWNAVRRRDARTGIYVGINPDTLEHRMDHEVPSGGRWRAADVQYGLTYDRKELHLTVYADHRPDEIDKAHGERFIFNPHKIRHPHDEEFKLRPYGKGALMVMSFMQDLNGRYILLPWKDGRDNPDDFDCSEALICVPVPGDPIENIQRYRALLHALSHVNVGQKQKQTMRCHGYSYHPDE